MGDQAALMTATGDAARCRAVSRNSVVGWETEERRFSLNREKMGGKIGQPHAMQPNRLYGPENTLTGSLAHAAVSLTTCANGDEK